MIDSEHYPQSIRFYEDGQITLTETAHLTPQDLYPELIEYNVLGFKVFQMDDPSPENSEYGYFYYSNTLNADMAKEIGNVIMSQIASNLEDQFITPPTSLNTQATLDILLTQVKPSIQRFTFATSETVHRLVLCTFNSKTGVSGNA